MQLYHTMTVELEEVVVVEEEAEGHKEIQATSVVAVPSGDLPILFLGALAIEAAVDQVCAVNSYSWGCCCCYCMDSWCRCRQPRVPRINDGDL